MAEKTSTLATKLAQIGKEIGAVSKSGRNSSQSYNFIEYAEVAGRIRSLFAEKNIIIAPSVEEIISSDAIANSRGGRGYHYILKMKFTVINGDDPSDIIERNWLGEAVDFGDKGINKAETSAVKYFIMRLFNISEKGEEEADSKSPELIASSPRVKISSSARTFKREDAPKIDFDGFRAWVNSITEKKPLREKYAEISDSKEYTPNQKAVLQKMILERQAKLPSEEEGDSLPTEEEVDNFEP